MSDVREVCQMTKCNVHLSSSYAAIVHCVLRTDAELCWLALSRKVAVHVGTCLAVAKTKGWSTEA